MYAEHSTLQIVAQVMIAFLFLYRGLDALPRFESHAAKLRERSVPFAGFVLACGLAILVVFFRNRGTIAVEDVNVMKG